jgi:hypothetical protein
MLDGERVAELVTDTVHEDTQIVRQGFDLTVDEVYGLETTAQLDFGGGEYEDAELAPKETRRPSRLFDHISEGEEGEYDWWDLDEGVYLLEHNEALVEGAEDEDLVLEPNGPLLSAGATHPTIHVVDLDPVPVRVPPRGVRVKENARVSTLRLLR